MRNPRIRIIVLSVIVIPIALACMASAQEPDAENCKDHPLLSRMKNYYIGECEKNFDAVEFIVEDESLKTLEGQKTFIRYYLQENAPQPSPLQIRRNYLNAIQSLGGKALYDQDYEATFKLVKSGKEIWVKLQVWNEGNDYGLTILEIEGMAQEVTADAMYAAITKDGFMALYINFDTGKSDIKPESLSIIGQIVALLKAHEDLRLSIEGHTDNVGTPASNKTLSEQRARSVMNAVTIQGIDASRLTAAGWGQEKPVADNRTEEGRAKNRRVEIVKK